LLVDDHLDPVCSLAVPEDTISDWHGAWRMLAERHPGQVDLVLANAGGILAQDPKDCPLTVVRALFALVEFLAADLALPRPHRLHGSAAVKSYLDERFYFGPLPDRQRSGIQLGIDGHLHSLLEADPAWPESWLAAFFAWMGSSRKPAPGIQADFIQSAVEQYEFLYASARIQQDGEVMRSFVAFSRALAERLERDDRYQPYRRRLADIYEVIVCHESDLNVARDGLLSLLGEEGSLANKWQRFSRLIHNLKRAQGPSDGARPAASERLATLTGLIADYYLDNYDLSRTVAAWRQLGLKDPLLTALLTLLQRPGPLLASHVLAFVLLAGLALVQSSAWAAPIAAPHAGPLSFIGALSGLLFLLLLLGPLLSSLGVIYNLVTRRLYYAQLILPRMLGAIIVGLCVLVLDDLPWKITLRMPLLTLLLLAGGVYFLSYLYILFDVHQTIRFESWSEFDGEHRRRAVRKGMNRPGVSALRPGGHAATTSGAESTLGYATWIGLRVFAIGIVQSFLATLFVSGLLLPLVFAEEVQRGVMPWASSSLGWIALGSGRGELPTFVFVPALVLLWTGMALFIGAFAQLLWQERHVMSPARE